LNTLPLHGRIDCACCFPGYNCPQFDQTKRTESTWRITANPLAWGNPTPEVLVLGFSKGPTQAGALDSAPHDAIAYKGGRAAVGKILAHLGLLSAPAPSTLADTASAAIADPAGRFHFGSLVRCTVERLDAKHNVWSGSGGRMLDRFVQTTFGQMVAKNCSERFLAHLPAETRLVVMFGLGSKLNYVRETHKIFTVARGGHWTWLNEVAYTDGKIVVVHVEHFAARGALLPHWLGQDGHERSRYGRMAQGAVQSSGVRLARIPTPVSTTTMGFVSMTPQVLPMVAEQNCVLPAACHAEGMYTEITAILETVERAGYNMTKNINKVAAFKSPTGQTLYIVKTSRLNGISVMVHPTLNPEILRQLDGVHTVSNDHRFHSNLTEFPKRINLGKTETSYGWQIRLETLEELSRFLLVFRKVSSLC